MKRVVIAGGGYAGLRAIKELVKLENIEIVLIDKNSYHYMQTEVYDFIANKGALSNFIVDLQSVCSGYSKNIKFICKEIKKVNHQESEIEFEGSKLKYDYLLLALGSRTFFPDFIDGLRDNAHGVKSISKALYFKQEFEKAIHERLKPNCQKEFNIVVGGAGLSGVEIASEMAHYANRFYKRGNFKDCQVSIYLIDAYETILFGLDKFLIETSMKRLKSLGVKVLHNNRIVKIDKERVYLDSNKEINYNFIIFTGGIIASTLTEKLDLNRNKKGHLEINKFLQVKDNIFAIGDIADFKDKNGNFVPPTAQTAKSSAEMAVKNIYNLINKLELEEYEPKSQGTLIALGGKYACGILFNKIRVKGYIAYLLKKLIFLIYKVPLQRLAKIGYKKRMVN